MHAEMNRHSWVRNGKFVQSFKKLIPLILLALCRVIRQDVKQLIKYFEPGKIVSLLAFNILLEILASEIRQVKETKHISDYKGSCKLSSFTDTIA